MKLSTLLLFFFAVGCNRRGRNHDARLEGVNVSGETVLLGSRKDTLSIRITTANTLPEPRTLTYMRCPFVTTRVTSVEQTQGRPVHTWDYATMLDPQVNEPHTGIGCSSVATFTLPPHTSVLDTFLTIPVSRVLADSLPAGRYRVTATPGLMGLRDGRVDAGVVDLRVATDSTQARVRK
jgi:hypothetical protein